MPSPICQRNRDWAFLSLQNLSLRNQSVYHSEAKVLSLQNLSCYNDET